MKIKCVWEHNGNDTMLYTQEFSGAFTRGENKEAAMRKMAEEITSYLKWESSSETESAQNMRESNDYEVEIVQEKSSDLQIVDADTDVLFDQEKEPLTMEEYQELKRLALKSAADFHALYEAIPDKDKSCLKAKITFYGTAPRTAREMYIHTRDVNSYYFGNIGIEADHEDNILDCRKRGFELLEEKEDFLLNNVVEGCDEELWSVRKLLRRFLWHDRIHAKAMYRMARKTFPKAEIVDPFQFG